MFYDEHFEKRWPNCGKAAQSKHLIVSRSRAARHTRQLMRNVDRQNTPTAYNAPMLFIETSIFTKEIQYLLPDDNYRILQTALMLRPDAGSLIKGSGGLRKIRWNLPGAGKRGSLRVIYYLSPP